MICTIIQRDFAKLDESGVASESGADMAHHSDSRRAYKTALANYRKFSDRYKANLYDMEKVTSDGEEEVEEERVYTHAMYE